MTSTIPSQGTVRPRISEQPFTARLFVDDELALEQEANRRGVSVASVLREIVRAHYCPSAAAESA